MSDPITITVKLFAIYQEIYGTETLTWQMPVGTTVRDILTRLITEYPELEPWRSVTRFGVNFTFVSEDTALQSGDEVVLIPPVSGG